MESITSCRRLYSEQLLLVCARHYEKCINILVATRRVTTVYVYAGAVY